MKIKFGLVLLGLILPTALITAQMPMANSPVSTVKKSSALQKIRGQYKNQNESGMFLQNGSNNTETALNCDDQNLILAPTAAPCNGISVTSINFLAANRTLVSGTANTVGAVYKYANAGTAPDGTAVDAQVKVVSYSNNQDANQTNFTEADTTTVQGSTTAIGYDQNLQPSINQESATYNGATTWAGSIQYQISFFVAGTNTPKVLTISAISTDNDGASAAQNGCGGDLRESVTYNAGLNQILIDANGTTQTISGTTVQGPAVNQANIGIGSAYANAALFVNVSQFNWSYSFNAPNVTCASGSASPGRYGSLNLSCQITFDHPFVSFPLSGNVYNDANGLTDSIVNGTGTGTPSATQLYANLVDSNGFVFSSVAVNADGTYTFPTAVNGAYTVQISTTQGVESSTAPAIALPAGWVNTGENLGAAAGNDGLTNGLGNGSLAVTVNGAAVTNANFGIEQRPVANNNTAASQSNPGGTNSATVPATTFSATDAAPGTISSIRITAFPSNATSITINGTTYTSTTFPAAGVTVPTNAAGNPTQAILVDPVNGAVTVAIPYVALDNAGVPSSTVATASVPFATLSISGNVFNDTNGLTDSIVNGTGTNAGGLFANLISGGVVVQSVAIPASGVYSFAGLDSGSYSVQISTNAGTVGSAAPAIALPAGWVNTGENLGAGAGSDGTANGLLAVALGTTNVANANFGIEQRPTANNNTAASQGNPGGTTNATVPATTFSGADTGTNTVSSIRISSFPTNATSITINGTTYTSTTFPAGGVTVPTNAAGNPTQAILVDPVDGAVTVAITYFTIDAAGVESSTSATASVPFALSSISGNVFHDTNGLNGTPLNTVDGTGTNAGGLFANLLDSNGVVVQSVAVPASGVYSFTGLNGGNYSVQISTNAGTVGSAAPATALPAGWVNTGENLGAGAGSDGTVNGLLTVALGTTNVANANFGIDQRPTAANNTATSQVNPGGTNSATVPATTFSGTDPLSNTVANIRITAFPSNATSITINGTTYTSTTFPAAGVIVPTNAAGNPTQTITVDPINGAVTVAIPYVAIDAAGVESSASATASVPFTTASLSGNVFNDTNGLTDSIVNGTGTNAGGLFANLLDSNGVVVQSVAVSAGGTYSFAGLNAGNYSVQISTNAGTVGSAAPATALPAGWVNTGENLGAGAGSDGTVNGLLAVTVAGNVTNANFGIEQRPTANNNTAASQGNPGGTNNVTVAPTLFTASDVSGGTVSSIRITAFPSNATSITINGTTYTSTTFPAAGVTVPTNAAGNPTQAITVDPIDGAVTVGINYVAIDNAGVESATPATASLPFVPVIISGNVFNDTNGLTDSIVNGTGSNAGGPLYANLFTSGGVFVQSVLVASNGAYSFSGVSSGTYSVQISTNQATAGNGIPATVLPAGWVNTGENIGTGAGSDGTVNGLISVTIAATPVNVANVNFGIEQRPTANNNTAASQVNQGGTTNATVAPTTFSATDPVTNTVSSIRITAFPSNATSITINGTTYTSTTFPAAGVIVPTNAAGNPTQAILVDPSFTGAGSVVIPYVAIDGAGVESSTPANATVPFTVSPTASNATVSGKLFSGDKPLANTLVTMTDLTTNNKKVVRTDAAGEYSFDAEVGRTYVVQPLSSKYAFDNPSQTINLTGDAAGLNFNSSPKKYHPKNDFDGDGKSDVVVFRASEGKWYVKQSSDDSLVVFDWGKEGDVPVSADFDGDGKNDFAVFRPSDGNWYIWQSKSQKMQIESFGMNGDKAMPADFDGDGKADVAVYRDGLWYVRQSSDNGFRAESFGLSTDVPFTGDVDGDGKSDFSVYRADTGMWYSRNSADYGFTAHSFGLATDVPVLSDFDGDGRADIGQYRDGTWYELNSTTNFEASQLGKTGDQTFTGDFDGDGRTDTAVYRDGVWTIRLSADGSTKTVSFGLPTDTLVK